MRQIERVPIEEQYPARDADEDAIEAWRESVRRIPGVVVHERSRHGPYVPKIRASYPIDVRELIGRCDDDDDGDRSSPVG